MISFLPQKAFIRAASLSRPNALSKVVAGIFLFLSIRTDTTHFLSVANSNHAHFFGLILAVYTPASISNDIPSALII